MSKEWTDNLLIIKIMKIYKTQAEVEKDIVDGVLNCKDEDVKFECDINISASIVNARDIKAWNIKVWNIKAWNINALDITALDINAGNITARNINVWNIRYYAFCVVYNSIKCISIKAIRGKYIGPICLDGQLTIVNSQKSEMIKKADELIAKANELKNEAEKL